MKKLYSTSEHKEYTRRRNILIARLANKRAEKQYTYAIYDRVTKFKGDEFLNLVIPAPNDFRLFENTEQCLLFFRQIRDRNNHNSRRFKQGAGYVSISLKEVRTIDYATISILNAIGDDLNALDVTLRGDFPADKNCREFLIDSGFLDHVRDRFGRKYGRSNNSEMIFFEKGCGKLSNADNVRIAEGVKNVVQYLTGVRKHFNPVKTILLEICGNSIEHGYISNNRHWLLGMKYEADKVIFTVSDVGKGILETIYKKFLIELTEIITKPKRHEVLMGAFERKYGSSTQEENRNKGLPAIKEGYQNGKILNLKVMTNDVFLHFGNENTTRTFLRGTPRLKGTIYQWEVTKECINN